MEDRLSRLEAKHQVMTALLHALCKTHPARAAANAAFEEKIDALFALWSARRAELSNSFFDAAEIARHAFQKSLTDEAPATH